MAEACGGWRGRGRWQRGNVVGSQRWKLRKNTRLPAVQAHPWAPTAPHEGPSSPPPALIPLAPPGLGFIHNLSALGGRPASPEPLKSALGVPKPQPGCWSQGLCRPWKVAKTNSARLSEGTVPPRGLSVAQQGQHCPQACPGYELSAPSCLGSLLLPLLHMFGGFIFPLLSLRLLNHLFPSL